MLKSNAVIKPKVSFHRSRVELVAGQTEKRAERTGSTLSSQNNTSVPLPVSPEIASDFTVLVVNSGQEMAKEITMQLTLRMPGCSIMYAPTIELAKWIVKRRKIHLLVSSPILPDGSISKLQEALEQLEEPPDVVVVGDPNIRTAEMLKTSRYQFSTARRLGNRPATLEQPTRSNGINKTLKSLGADIRNDLNNPLQEIVAMVFVAKANGERAQGVNQALQAIDQAAQNMASVVKGIEDKIRTAVEPFG